MFIKTDENAKAAYRWLVKDGNAHLANAVAHALCNGDGPSFTGVNSHLHSDLDTERRAKFAGYVDGTLDIDGNPVD